MAFLAQAHDFDDGPDEFLVPIDFNDEDSSDERFIASELPTKMMKARMDTDDTAVTEMSSESSMIQPIQEDQNTPVSSPTFLPRKGSLKSFNIDDIPVSTKKNSWKSLPVPDLTKIKASEMSRTESMGSFFHHSPLPSPKIRKSSSKVNFQDVTIREYDLTLGDNPSVSCGPPISLDWTYSENDSLCLNAYEGNRPQRRTSRQLCVNYYQRMNILSNLGHTEEEIKQAKNEAKKSKNQRAITRQFLPLSKVEDVVTSASRKAKRIMGGGKKKQQDVIASNTVPTSEQVLATHSTDESLKEVRNNPTFIRRSTSTPVLSS
mmetsp:Transcript_19593/g.27196  ORF Transcript_19593/g.27196 Transcript_19593/m.27196 type:complete len:319 (-) Transcript_19593:1918-2874(-)